MPSSTTQATTRAAYDLVASDYARLLPGTAAEAPADLAIIGRFSASVPEGGPILDAGCGTGRMIGHLHELGHLHLAGVDLSPGMIAQATSAYPEASFAVAELAELPYPDHHFDGILAWYSIIHTPPEELGPLWAQFHRVLRSGGSLLLGFQAGTGSRQIRFAYGHQVEMTAQRHDPADLVARLEAAGFIVDEDLQRAPCGPEFGPQGFLRAHRR